MDLSTSKLCSIIEQLGLPGEGTAGFGGVFWTRVVYF